MPVQYEFSCPHCSGLVPLKTTQAGQAVDCPHCDTSFDTPQLGQLRQCPVIDQAGGRRVRGTASMAGRYLFAAGLTLAMVAGIAAWQLHRFAHSLMNDVDVEMYMNHVNEELDQQSSAGIYYAATEITRDMPLEYREPPYLRNDRQGTILSWFAWGLWGLTGIGAAMLLASFFMRTSDP